MVHQKAAKPATDIGEPAPNSEQLGGPLSIPHTSHTANVQEVRCDLVGSDKAIAGDIMASGAFDLCRRLLAAGANPAAELVCYRNGTLALRIKSIGAGARLTVRETATDGPRLVTWKPFPHRAVTAPVRSNRKPVQSAVLSESAVRANP
jgi:hypothetical protein